LKDILSQSEIDRLLEAVSTGELEVDNLIDQPKEKPVKTYDFKRPNKFSKEHLRTLHMIHSNFGRILGNFLSAYLRTPVQINVASVDQMTYEDFIRSVPSPTLVTIFSLDPLKGVALMETNPNFSFPVIDLLFGGPGESPREVRDLTEIELSVLRKLNTKILENLAFSWSDIFKIEPKLESLETNPHFNQAVTLNETVAIITFDTYVGESRGLINLCLPFVTLDPLMSKLSAHYWFAQQKNKETGLELRALEFLLNTADLKLLAMAGDTSLTVREFIQLQQGDIIKLDKFINEEFDLLVEDELKFKIQPGITRNNRIGVEVTRLVREEEEEDGE